MNFDWQSLKDFRVTTPNPDHLPIAYGLLALGLWAVVKNPAKIASIVGGAFLVKNLMEQGKEHLTQSASSQNQ